MTTQTLIALVDASAYARSVCEHAAWLAARAGARVRLYHVMGRRGGAGRQDLSGALGLGARSALLDQLATLDEARAKLAMEHGRAILEDGRAIIAAAGVEVEMRLRQGDLVETVTDTEAEAELIVIGKRGEAAGLAAAHLGSNLERIVRAAHGPVLVANRAFRPLSRVLLAFDGGASALKAVEHVARAPMLAGLAVTLVHAGRETPEIVRALDSARATLAAGGIAAETVLRPGEPEQVLAEMTGDGGHDLLVMGAYGHSRMRRLIIGSTTTEMIRSCKVPVLLMR